MFRYFVVTILLFSICTHVIADTDDVNVQSRLDIKFPDGCGADYSPFFERLSETYNNLVAHKYISFLDNPALLFPTWTDKPDKKIDHYLYIRFRALPELLSKNKEKKYIYKLVQVIVAKRLRHTNNQFLTLVEISSVNSHGNLFEYYEHGIENDLISRTVVIDNTNVNSLSEDCGNMFRTRKWDSDGKLLDYSKERYDKDAILEKYRSISPSHGIYQDSDNFSSKIYERIIKPSIDIASKKQPVVIGRVCSYIEAINNDDCTSLTNNPYLNPERMNVSSEILFRDKSLLHLFVSQTPAKPLIQNQFNMVNGFILTFNGNHITKYLEGNLIQQDIISSNKNNEKESHLIVSIDGNGTEIKFHPTGYPASYKTIVKNRLFGRQIEWNDKGEVISDVDLDIPKPWADAPKKDEDNGLKK